MVGLVHLVDPAVECRVVDGVARGEELVPGLAHRGSCCKERELATVEAGDVGGEVAREQAGLGEQHRDVGVAHEELELGKRGERRQRHRDRAGHRGSEQRGDRFGPVAHQHPDASALTQSCRDQRLGHAPRLVAEIGVGPSNRLAAE